HWMDPERAVPEIGRVLRDGGRFGLIWTSRDRDVDWVRDLDLLPGDERTEADAPERFRQLHENVTLPDPQIFHQVAREAFTFVRTMRLDDVVGMVGTYSRIITASPDDRERRLANARAVLRERFPAADSIDVPMQSRCWRADRMPRGC
ncbi:SAM-dependent methyltransferase, partial [Mycobacterium kansasii]